MQLKAELVWIDYQIRERVDHGILQPEQWGRAPGFNVSTGNGPGSQEIWAQMKFSFDPEFVRAIESAVP